VSITDASDIPEFRRAAAHVVISRDQPLSFAPEILDIDPPTLSFWVHQETRRERGSPEHDARHASE
jgi:transposase-like protein